MARAEKRQKTLRLPVQITATVAAAADKKATDLVILDLRKTAGFTDFFVICSGGNSRQVRAIAEGIQDALAPDGVKPSHIEGSEKSGWILLDYFDFVVHIFAPDTRTFYDLERLWGNAERIDPQVQGTEHGHEASGPHDRLAGAEDSR